MIPIEVFCAVQSDSELHEMITHVNEKPRWERSEASYVMLKAAIKELKKRGNLVQSG
jgi:hypothetical protein